MDNQRFKFQYNISPQTAQISIIIILVYAQRTYLHAQIQLCVYVNSVHHCIVCQSYALQPNIMLQYFCTYKIQINFSLLYPHKQIYAYTCLTNAYIRLWMLVWVQVRVFNKGIVYFLGFQKFGKRQQWKDTHSCHVYCIIFGILQIIIRCLLQANVIGYLWVKMWKKILIRFGKE